jgi:hypothetical protein
MQFNFRHVMTAGLIYGVFALSAASNASPILDQSQTTSFGISPAGYPSTFNWQAQTVSPTQGTLTSIDINFADDRSISATVAVYGQTTDNGFSLATLLGSSTKQIGSTTGTWIRGWYSFDFNNLDISSYTSAHGTGRLLFVVKSNSDQETDELRRIYGSNTDLYAGGLWKYTPDSGSTWLKVGGASKNYDMAFRLYTVPEPGSLALFGLGAGGLLLKRRRRK